MQWSFAASAAAQAALAERMRRVNTRWAARLHLFRRHSAPPWWVPGLLVTDELRWAYERFLPVDEFLDDLFLAAQRVLPDPAWIPAVLRRPQWRPAPVPGVRRPGSLPDLWRRLPPSLAGRVVFAPDEILALLCALADPASFGTASERYPAQRDALARRFAMPGPGDLRILDIGCGVGHGSREIAALAAERRPGARAVRVVGITREPLEAWMAAAQCLPHDHVRSSQLRAFGTQEAVHFLAGDAQAVPLATGFDIIVCNGLVGGPYLERPGQFQSVLGEFRRLLAADGVVTLANRFHAGRTSAIAAFAARARADGWIVRGGPELLWLGA